MQTLERVTFALAPEKQEFIRLQVETGRFDSVEDAIHAALQLLMDQTLTDDELDSGSEFGKEERKAWERDVLLPAYTQYKANPTSVRTSEEVDSSMDLARLQRRRAS